MKLLITNVVFSFPCQNNDLDTLEHTKLHGKYRNSFQLTSTRYFHNINLKIIYFFNQKEFYTVSADHAWVICEGEDYFCCQYRRLFVTVLPNNGVVRKTCVSHNLRIHRFRISFYVNVTGMKLDTVIGKLGVITIICLITYQFL